MVRRFLLIPFAVILAAGTGGLFLLLASLIDPVMADLMGKTVFASFQILSDILAESHDPAPLILDLLGGIARILFGLLVLPPFLVALVSEIIHADSLLWLATATGILTAAVPWVLRGTFRIPSLAELHVSLILGLAGTVSGLVYSSLTRKN